MSDNYVNLLINEKIPIQNELNLEQHKKSAELELDPEDVAFMRESAEAIDK